MSSLIDGVDYGPLTNLLGRWTGINGRDTAPNSFANPEVSAYSDDLKFEPAGKTVNAGEQELLAVRYQHVARNSASGAVIHSQIGHWFYEVETGLVMHSLSIPRGVCLLAGGSHFASGGEQSFVVEAKQGDPTFGIVQSPFLTNKARTLRFQMALSLNGNSLEYTQTTFLEIGGKPFEHTDSSVLRKLSGALDYHYREL